MTRGTPIRVLHIEDDDLDALQFQTSMDNYSAHPLNIHRVKSMSDAEEIVGVGQFDLVICDLHLPDTANPKDTLDRITRATPTPVVILTGADEHVTRGLSDANAPRVSKDCGLGPNLAYAPQSFAKALDQAIESLGLQA